MQTLALLAIPCLLGVGDVRPLSHAELRGQRATLVYRGVVQDRGSPASVTAPTVEVFKSVPSRLRRLSWDHTAL